MEPVVCFGDTRLSECEGVVPFKDEYGFWRSKFTRISSGSGRISRRRVDETTPHDDYVHYRGTHGLGPQYGGKFTDEQLSLLDYLLDASDQLEYDFNLCRHDPDCEILRPTSRVLIRLMFWRRLLMLGELDWIWDAEHYMDTLQNTERAEIVGLLNARLAAEWKAFYRDDEELRQALTTH